MGHAHVDLGKIDPWADPSPAQSGYWMGLLALIVAFSIFAGTYLAWEYMVAFQVGERAPTYDAPVERLNRAQEAELAKTVVGDRLRLKDGRELDEGLVVDVTDDAGQRTIYVCSAHYLVVQDPQLTMIRLGEEELKFTPSQVEGIQKGKGKKLTVPLGEGMRRYVDHYRSRRSG